MYTPNELFLSQIFIKIFFWKKFKTNKMVVAIVLPTGEVGLKFSDGDGPNLCRVKK